MTDVPSCEPAAPADCQDDLPLALRVHTSLAHQRLERSLDLHGRLRDKLRFVGVLERFFGFHLVWEAAIAERPSLREFHRPRRRVAALAQDLLALGHTQARIDSLPSCSEASALAASDGAALGSMYVMEGSTLGGQLITRALLTSAWAPQGGLGYFDPYGRRTGEMWREFKDWLVRHPGAAERRCVLEGARGAFDLLHDWVSG